MVYVGNSFRYAWKIVCRYCADKAEISSQRRLRGKYEPERSESEDVRKTETGTANTQGRESLTSVQGAHRMSIFTFLFAYAFKARANMAVFDTMSMHNTYWKYTLIRSEKNRISSVDFCKNTKNGLESLFWGQFDWFFRVPIPCPPAKYPPADKRLACARFPDMLKHENRACVAKKSSPLKNCIFAPRSEKN